MDAFSVFFKKAEEFIGYESARMKDLPSTPSIPLKIFKEAYELEASLKPDAKKKRLIIRLKGTKNYILSSGASKFTNGTELFAAYRRLFHDGPANWDEYACTRFSVYLVQLVNRFGDDYYTCTCWDGSKKQICKHAVMVACTMEKAQSYPAEVTAQTMKPNRKRSHKKSAGRDPLAPTQNRFSAAD